MSARRFIALVAFATLWFAAIKPLHAERLVISLSTHRVLITSNFTGTDLVLFGSIEHDGTGIARRGGYDIVVQVTGPRETMVTRRKDHRFGLWVNTQSRTFVDAPGYLAVLANRPLNSIASPDTLKHLQIGLDNISLPQSSNGGTAANANDVFRTAFVRLNVEHGLYREEPTSVTLLTPALFRASITMPANIPTGNYDVDVKLFADGTMITHQTSAIEIAESGFEQFVATSAREHGLLYGFVISGLALLTGWFASIIFRRD